MFSDILIGYGIVNSLNFIFVSLKMFTVNFHQPMHDTDHRLQQLEKIWQECDRKIVGPS